MKDARLRVFCTLALSLAAFSSVAGAAMVCLWWLVFSRRLGSLPAPKIIFLVAVPLAVAAAETEIASGGGLSYFFRLSAVFLVAFWAYGERVPGELLGAGASLFGRGIGFDLGLAGEMGMEALASLEEDIARIRMALQLKGKRWGPGMIAPFGRAILHAQMRRSAERAALLAVRGYRGGGSICPCFTRTRADYAATVLAGIVVFLSFVPLSDVFI
jgi:energy-coupling factor transport system permease protein